MTHFDIDETVTTTPNEIGTDFSVASGDPSGPEPDFGPDGLYANFDELIGMSQTVVGTDKDDILTGPQAAGAETNPDYFLGYGGYDTFVLGNEEEAFYLNNAEALAIIGDFEVEVDQIQLHGFVEDYSLGASAAQTDTAIIHNGTQQVVGWIVGIPRSELIGSSAFTFVSNYEGPPDPPPDPDPIGAL